MKPSSATPSRITKATAIEIDVAKAEDFRKAHEAGAEHYADVRVTVGDEAVEMTLDEFTRRVFARSEIAGWTEGDFLDQALDNATGTILSPYAAGKIRERAKELRAKAPRSAIASHQSVWEVENKTTRILFSTKESAQSFINTFPASVAGGMQLRQVGVV